MFNFSIINRFVYGTVTEEIRKIFLSKI